MKWTENIERDVVLFRAALAGGIDAVRAAAMALPDFAGGPDTVTSYSHWMSLPSRRAYRLKVAEAYLTSEKEKSLGLEIHHVCKQDRGHNDAVPSYLPGQDGTR